MHNDAQTITIWFEDSISRRSVSAWNNAAWNEVSLEYSTEGPRPLRRIAPLAADE